MTKVTKITTPATVPAEIVVKEKVGGTVGGTVHASNPKCQELVARIEAVGGLQKLPELVIKGKVGSRPLVTPAEFQMLETFYEQALSLSRTAKVEQCSSSNVLCRLYGKKEKNSNKVAKGVLGKLQEYMEQNASVAAGE